MSKVKHGIVRMSQISVFWCFLPHLCHRGYDFPLGEMGATLCMALFCRDAVGFTSLARRQSPSAREASTTRCTKFWYARKFASEKCQCCAAGIGFVNLEPNVFLRRCVLFLNIYFIFLWMYLPVLFGFKEIIFFLFVWFHLWSEIVKVRGVSLIAWSRLRVWKCAVWFIAVRCHNYNYYTFINSNYTLLWQIWKCFTRVPTADCRDSRRLFLVSHHIHYIDIM